jgi:hypothetical protein
MKIKLDRSILGGTDFLAVCPAHTILLSVIPLIVWSNVYGMEHHGGLFMDAGLTISASSVTLFSPHLKN